MKARREKLLNVRISADEAAMAAELRARGVEMSGLVRDAIRTEYGRRRRRLRPRDVDDVLEAIHARHPDPADTPSDRPDVHDRRAFQVAVHRRLRRRGRS